MQLEIYTETRCVTFEAAVFAQEAIQSKALCFAITWYLLHTTRPETAEISLDKPFFNHPTVKTV